MGQVTKAGFPVISAIFLALAAFKFLGGGGGWVVWLILGVLFGGLGVFSAARRGGNG